MTASTPAGRPVCVLTLGRSGSSLVANALRAFGLEIGPDEAMYQPDRHNPRGYGELREVNALNDAILDALGGSLWHPPRSVPPGWEERAEFGSLREQMRAFASRMQASGRRWAFKDTRTVHTLPLWRAVVGEMDYILCVREPAEALASFAEVAYWVDRERHPGLWIGANAAALRHTVGRRRLILAYADWFENGHAVVAQIADFLGVDASDAVRASVRELFEPGLRRHRTSATPATTETVPFEAQVLWILLCRLMRGDDSEAEQLAHCVDAVYFARVDAERGREAALAEAHEQRDAARVGEASALAEAERVRQELAAVTAYRPRRRWSPRRS